MEWYIFPACYFSMNFIKQNNVIASEKIKFYIKKMELTSKCGTNYIYILPIVYILPENIEINKLHLNPKSMIFFYLSKQNI